MEWIGLLDCNNFFVSCERLFRPDLKGKPVVVLSSNDGCVVARSQEIKDNGIPMGIPYFQIKDIIKDIEAVTFSSHFALYRDISRRVFEVMRGELEIVEQYSVDEAFFKITGDTQSVERQARALKDKVERLVGIPVSIGVASSKTQAKYAGSVAKKTNGVFVLESAEWENRIPAVKLASIWGVGLRSAEAFRAHGLLSVSDLLVLERRQVHELFGVVGERLWLELQGVQAGPLSRKTIVQKSLLNSRSFKETSSDISVLKDAIAYHIREAAEDLRGMKQKASTLQVSLGTSRHSDFLLQGGSVMVDLPSPTNDTFLLLKMAETLVDQLFKPGVPYKKAGVLLCNFVPETVNQLSIFDTVEQEKTNMLMPVIDAINKHSGKNSLLLGSHMQSKKWQALSESRSPAYTTNWKDIATVKA